METYKIALKKMMSLLTVLAMIIAGLGFLVSNPQDAYADTKTVKVNFTTSAYNAFVHPPQFDCEIKSDIAENYGYTDEVSSETGVSALDVLVKAHELIFGEESVTDELSVSETGWVTTSLGSGFGFAVNGKAAHDEIMTEYGYTGLMVNAVEVKSGDNLDFFVYQDPVGYSDNYVSFYEGETEVSSVTMIQGEAKTLSVKGYAFAWYGCYDDDTINSELIDINGAQIGLVNVLTGEITDIDDAVTDNGEVEIVCDEPGTYYLTAYMPEENENNSPIILRLLKVNVKTSEKVPAGSVDDDNSGEDIPDNEITGETEETGSTDVTTETTAAAKPENSPKTGDDFNAVPLIVIALCAAAVGGVTLIRRRPAVK